MTYKSGFNYGLGLQVIRNRSLKTIFIHQSKYIADKLKQFNMEHCKPIATPMEIGQKFLPSPCTSITTNNPNEDSFPYKEAVGSLVYAMTCTRPDICYAVMRISQHLQNPTPIHWIAVKRIFRYLKGTQHNGILYQGDEQSSKLTLISYSDADWAGDTIDRKSTSGYLFILANGAISWASKKQTTTALSTTEAEYIATTLAAKEAIWLRRLLEDLGEKQDSPTTILCDNQSAIALSENPKFHSKSKHIEMQFHYIRDQIHSKELRLEYCSTQQMYADYLTKSVGKEKHELCKQHSGLVDEHNI